MALFNVKNVGWIGSLTEIIATEFASLYQSFQDLTTLQKQHFVEWFSGDALDSIWTEDDGQGTGSSAMVDAIDGGYRITAGTGANDNRNIHFNNKRHYLQTGSVIIAIVKNGTAANSDCNIGFVSDESTVNHRCWMINHSTADSFFGVVCHDGTTSSKTLTDISNDTSFHLHKAELKASVAEYIIDGVLKASHTTNLPADKLQPMGRALSKSGNAAELTLRYLEAYNT